MKSEAQLMSDLHMLRIDYANAQKKGKMKEMEVPKRSFENTKIILELAYPNAETARSITEPPSESDCEGYASSDEKTKQDPSSSEKRKHSDIEVLDVEEMKSENKRLKSQNGVLWQMMRERKAKRDKEKAVGKAKVYKYPCPAEMCPVECQNLDRHLKRQHPDRYEEVHNMIYNENLQWIKNHQAEICQLSTQYTRTTSA